MRNGRRSFLSRDGGGYQANSNGRADRKRLENFQFARRDAEVVAPALVHHKRRSGRKLDFFGSPGFRSQFDSEPDAETGENGRRQPAVDFYRMLNYDESILGPLQQRDQNAAEGSAYQHFSNILLHKEL